MNFPRPNLLTVIVCLFLFSDCFALFAGSSWAAMPLGNSCGNEVCEPVQCAGPSENVAARGCEGSVPAKEIFVVGRIDDPAQDKLGQTPGLDAAEIRSMSPVSVTEALSLLPGIDAFEKGGLGSGSYVSVRGGDPNFTLVVLNGVRVNDPMQSSGGGFDFSLVDPGMVRRIDLLSAPYSTSYGSDALSGAISIKLGSGTSEQGLAASAGVGTGGRFSIGSRLSTAGEAGSFTVSANTSDTQEYLAGSSNQRHSLMVSVSPDLGDKLSLDLFGLYSASDSNGFPEDSGGPELAVLRAPEERERRQAALGAMLVAPVDETRAFQLRLGWTRSELTSVSPGIAPGAFDGVPPITTDSEFDRLELAAAYTASVGSWLSYSVGGNFVSESGRSNGSIDIGFPLPTMYRQQRSIAGVYAQATISNPGGMALSASIRTDFPDSGKTRWTPRFGAIVPLGKSGLSLVANYAKGFKRPSLFALGYPLIANPDLKDELSETADVGVMWESPDSNWQARVTAYRARYRNLIDFEPALFTNVNRQRITAKGLEFSVDGQHGALTVRTALTYMSTKSSDGSILRFRPHWKGRARVQWAATDNVALSVDGEFSSSYADSSIPTGFQTLEGHELLHAQIEWALTPSIELTLAVRNIGDQQYYRTIGTPEPGQNFHLGVSMVF